MRVREIGDPLADAPLWPRSLGGLSRVVKVHLEAVEDAVVTLQRRRLVVARLRLVEARLDDRHRQHAVAGGFGERKELVAEEPVAIANGIGMCFLRRYVNLQLNLGWVAERYLASIILIP